MSVRVEVGDRVDVDVDRVERERGKRAVRARLAVGELVRRQDLHETLAGAQEPRRAGGRSVICPIPQSVARANGEERNRQRRKPLPSSRCLFRMGTSARASTASLMRRGTLRASLDRLLPRPCRACPRLPVLV